MLYQLLLLVLTLASRSHRKALQQTLVRVPFLFGLGVGFCPVCELGFGNTVALNLLQRLFGPRARRRGNRELSGTGPSQRGELVCVSGGWGP